MTDKPLNGDDFDEDALYDGRQSEAAMRIMRGVSRMLAGQNFAGLPEVTLPNHRRADLLAVGAREIRIIEIKSSLSDFQTDKNGRIIWPIVTAFLPSSPIFRSTAPRRAGDIGGSLWCRNHSACACFPLAAARRSVITVVARVGQAD